MRIAHVVTLISADNAFGGPVSVARAQTQELARRGHEVTLHAGWDGIAACEVAGVEVRLHRVRRVVPAPGFAGLFAPSMVRALRRTTAELDAVHIHLGRDLVTLSAARSVRGRAPALVTQTHGMVMPDHRVTVRALDAVATRRALAAATSTAVLTDVERAGLLAVAGRPLPVVALPNGIALAPLRRSERNDAPPTVVFCARLHPRKRVLAFAEMAGIVLRAGRDVRFVIAGPDEGDGDALRRYLAAHRLADRVGYVGAVAPEGVRRLLADADVFVLPSEREPFPMTLLEAMAEGTASVITEGCMIAAQLGSAGAAVVADAAPAGLATAVLALLDDPSRARRLGMRGREVVAQNYTIAAVVDRLERLYTAEPS